MEKMRINNLKSRNANSILNAISSLLFTLVNGVLTIIVTNVILVKFGSDLNGINSAANQVVNILLILESGFTLASNVALFIPLKEKNREAIDNIISTTNDAFKKIGFLYLLIGSIAISIYAFFIISNYTYGIKFAVMLIAIIPTGINFLLSAKYQILFQSEQREYVINFLKTGCYVVGQISVILFAKICSDPVILRLSMAISPLLVCVLLYYIGKCVYGNVNFLKKPNYALIPGTKDLLVQKFVGLLYSTIPTLAISLKIGTIAISVYSVYSSVTILMKSIANAVMNAPRMSFGDLLSEGNNAKIKSIFAKYETVVLFIATVMSTCYFILIIPYVKVYTKNVTDANYLNSTLSILLGIIFFTECLHIPSGIYMNMAALFKQSKKIQVVAAGVLIVTTIVAIIIGTIESFVVSILIAAIALAAMEIYYVHQKVLNNLRQFVVRVIPYVIFVGAFGLFGFVFDFGVSSYLGLLIEGIIIGSISIVALLGIGYLIDKKTYSELVKTAIKLISNKQK